MNKALQDNNLKTRTAMNTKISKFVICVEAIIYLLLCNLHDFTFKELSLRSKLRNSLIVKYFELILKMTSSLLLIISKKLQLIKIFN